MKNLLKTSLLFILILNLIPYSTLPSSLMGSDISWRCIGRDSFMIKLSLYRDCTGVVLNNSMNITLKCSSSGTTISTLALPQTSITDITPTCLGSCTKCSNPNCSFPYGIEKYEFRGLAILTSAGSCCDVKIIFSYNSRSGLITTGAANQSFYTEALLNRCVSPCDNSPEFSNHQGILCIGQDFVFNSGLTDPDSNSNGSPMDSFSYEMSQPMIAYNTYPSWSTGYSYDKPVYFWGFPSSSLAFPRGFHLDPLTGDISFRPMKIEVTILCIKVNEFRNGVKIAELKREMTLIVINCPNNHAPSNGPAVYYKEVCAGDSVTFSIFSNDLDPNDSLSITHSGNIPGAVWSDNNGQVQHPTVNFSWVPADSQISNVPYLFFVSTSDNACLIPGRYTHAYQVLVKPYPKGNMSVSDSCEGNYYFSARTITGSFPTYLWNRNSLPDSFTKTGNSFYHKFSRPGLFPFSMAINSRGCITNYVDTVVVDTFLQASLPADTQICQNNTILINPTWSGARGKPAFRWSTSAADTLDHLNLQVTRDTIITLNISDQSNCVLKKSMKISIFPLPMVLAGPDLRICQGDSVILKASGAFRYLWSNGDTNPEIRLKPMKTTTYILYGWSDKGCVQNDAVEIFVYPLPIAEAGKNKEICFGEQTVLRASGGIGYDWHTNNVSDSITVKPLVSTWFNVRVFDLNGCSASDSVFVKVNPLPLAEAGIDTGICNGHLIKLTASGGTKYLWSTGDSTAATSYIVTNAGYQYVTVWNSFGCEKTDSVFVDVYPVPIAKFSASPVSGNVPLTVNFYDSSSVSSGSIAEYYWDFDNSNYSNVKNPVFIFNDSGSFDIRLTVKTDKGCTKSVLKQKLVNTIKVSIADNLKESVIEIIPNPAKDFVIIRVKSGYLKSISLINSVGKTILYRQNLNSTETKIQRPLSGKGVYLLHIISSDNRVFNTKVIFE